MPIHTLLLACEDFQHCTAASLPEGAQVATRRITCSITCFLCCSQECTIHSDKLMFNGEACCCNPRVDPELVVDGGQVPVDRTGANDELFCHLGICHALRDEAQHLDFAGGQSPRRAICLLCRNHLWLLCLPWRVFPSLSPGRQGLVFGSRAPPLPPPG